MIVIQKCVVPELHILQGFVNNLFWNGLIPLLSFLFKALLRPEKLGIFSKNYQGEIFEGNVCREFLINADNLLQKEISSGLSFAAKNFLN